MPTVKENHQRWLEYDFPEGGDEWSASWGGTGGLWWGTVFPRVQSGLEGSVLEIGPGYGRFTQFLLERCEDLTLVDLVPKCIEACRKRFREFNNINYLVNDGRSLSGVLDNSIDFAFSFDSLVHAEAEVLCSYISELKRVLVPGGRAFIHHSNVAGLADPVTGKQVVENPHWRGETASAGLVREYCALNQLDCRLQELVNWGVEDLTDCFTSLIKPKDDISEEAVLAENPEFMEEARLIRGYSDLYRCMGEAYSTSEST